MEEAGSNKLSNDIKHQKAISPPVCSEWQFYTIARRDATGDEDL